MAFGPLLFLPALFGLIAGAPGLAEEDAPLAACADLEGAAWRACVLHEARTVLRSVNETRPAVDLVSNTTLDTAVGLHGGPVDAVLADAGITANATVQAEADAVCPCALPAHYRAILDRHAPPERPTTTPVPTTPDPAPAAPHAQEAVETTTPRWVVPVVALGALPVAAAFLPGHGLLARVPWRRLAAFVPLAGIGLFSRIRPDDMLENGTRQGIAEALRERPGRSIQELRDGLGIAWGTAVYHLERLESAGLVVSHRTGNHRRYYLANSLEARHRDGLGVLETETARRLAAAVITEPGVTQKGLCARVGIRHPVASKYLKRMEQHMLVTTETRDRFRCYTPTSRLRELAPRMLDE